MHVYAKNLKSGTCTGTLMDVECYEWHLGAGAPYDGSYNGSILVHASGGTPPYTYSFDGGPYQGSALYVTDGPFDHKVSVKDATLTLQSTGGPLVSV